MKAQAFFKSGASKDHAEKVRQVGHSGSVQSKTGHIAPKVTVKQARTSSVPSSMSRKTTVKQVGTKGSC